MLASLIRAVAMRPPIDFYFDFSSPYSYIASEWVQAVAARHGRAVQWRAILLGATFQAAELKPPVSYPLKREYSLRDIVRSARFAGVPFEMPDKFPIPTQNAARIFWWLHDGTSPEAAVAWAHAGLRAYFTRGVDLSETAQLRSLLVESGVDVAAAEAAYTHPLWKERLKRENDMAIANGVFGAPFFIVDGEPFWGNDRRAQLEAWISGQADYSHTVM
jgi:2-hydroxychromene-2-carboxylate isomerase